MFLPAGFGLVEALVAIGVLIIGLVAVATMSQSNLISSEGIQYRLVAVNLAREGVEAVRSLRDDNWLQGKTNISGLQNAWDEGFNGGTDFTAIPVLNTMSMNWQMDFIPNDFNHASTKLARDRVKNLYRQPAGPQDNNTHYSRLLWLYAICTNQTGTVFRYDNIAACSGSYPVKAGVRVISRVQWQEAGRTNGLEVEEWLFNWRYGFKPYVPE